MLKTLLLVDDEVALARAMERLLKKHGYRVVIAITADEALQALQDYTIDLCVTDLAMPGKSGIDLMREIRSNPQTKNLPILIFTGFVESVTQDVLKLNPLRVLKKPVAIDDLVSAIQDALGEKVGK